MNTSHGTISRINSLLPLLLKVVALAVSIALHVFQTGGVITLGLIIGSALALIKDVFRRLRW